MSEPFDTSGNRVSTLELFFDLVFVFTITQVALVVEHHASWHSAGQAVLELLVIFWMYGGFAWLTNSIGSSSPKARAVLVAGMAAFLVVSLSVPRAFDEDGTAFGYAYLVLTLVHAGGFLLLSEGSAITSMLRIAPANIVAAVLVLTAGYVHGGAHWPLWLAAVAVQWLPALLTLNRGAFAVDVAHFAERHALMIIIVLGESLVSVALAAEHVSVDGTLVLGVLSGFAASVAMWWCYFADDSEKASEALAAAPVERRGPLALRGYDLPHLVMMAGVVFVAAGTRLSLHDLTARTTHPAAWLIAGGLAVYLIGLAAFRLVLGFGNPGSRLVAAGLVLGCVPIGIVGGAAQELAAAAACIAAMLVTERVRSKVTAAP